MVRPKGKRKSIDEQCNKKHTQRSSRGSTSMSKQDVNKESSSFTAEEKPPGKTKRRQVTKTFASNEILISIDRKKQKRKLPEKIKDTSDNQPKGKQNKCSNSKRRKVSTDEQERSTCVEDGEESKIKKTEITKRNTKSKAKTKKNIESNTDNSNPLSQVYDNQSQFKQQNVKDKYPKLKCKKSKSETSQKINKSSSVKKEETLHELPFAVDKDEIVEKSMDKSPVSLMNFKAEDLKHSIKPKKIIKQTTPVKTNITSDQGDIRDLLLKFESIDETVKHHDKSSGSGNVNMMCDSEDISDESDWEEVADIPTSETLIKSQLPSEPVEITVEAPNIMKKKKKKKFDIQDWFRLQMNKFKRETQKGVHKVHLLCLVAHGICRSNVCNLDILKAYMMSHIPVQFHGVPLKKWSLSTLTAFTRWFCSKFTIDNVDEKDEAQTKGLINTLITSAEKCSVRYPAHYIYLFLTSLRILELESRLILSLQPVPYKATDLKAKPDSTAKNNESSTSNAKSKKSLKGHKKASTSLVNVKSNAKSEKANKKQKSNRSKLKKAPNDETVSPYFSDNSSWSPGAVPAKLCSKKSKGKNIIKSDGTQEENDDDNNQISKESSEKVTNSGNVDELSVPLSTTRSATKVKSYKERSESSSEDEDESTHDKGGSGDIGLGETCDVKKNIKKKKDRICSRSNDKINKDVQMEKGIGSDDDFEPKQKVFRSPKIPVKKSPKNPVKILSSDSSDGEMYINDNGTDTWIEVYLEDEKQWICVDCLRQSINKPKEIEDSATQPIIYILAFHNGGYVKDITKKYVQNWLSHTRKLRIDENWWEETMSAFKPPISKETQKEDRQIQANLMKTPMPTVIGEFKNHPLYALKRHLLKFEAIYPADAPTLGFIRGEPVYARECVHTLHSRENWLKEARLVRIGEEAYKWVKARPKRNKPTENPNEATLQLFGYWQTEDYIPPPAIDGKVPRNEYGNVELFKPSMLPGGTVHLEGLPGLNRIAKKLGLDCVAAMTGWDHHSGYAHPTLDGWVVCEEHKDILLAAWDEQQEIDRQREAEKREKRVLEKWRKFTKALLIKEKLKNKYNLGDSNKKSPKDGSKHSKSSDLLDSSKEQIMSQKATDTAIAWPMNRQEEKRQQEEMSNNTMKKKKKEKAPLFPFEMETM